MNVAPLLTPKSKQISCDTNIRSVRGIKKTTTTEQTQNKPTKQNKTNKQIRLVYYIAHYFVNPRSQLRLEFNHVVNKYLELFNSFRILLQTASQCPERLTRVYPQGCLRNSINVGVVEHRSFLTSEGGTSAPSFPHCSVLQEIDALMLLSFHVQKVPRCV